MKVLIGAIVVAMFFTALFVSKERKGCVAANPEGQRPPLTTLH